MKLEIYSDVVCPWCYIGKRRLERALADYPGAAEVEVSFRPFQLDSGAPTTPVPLREAYLAKFGDQAKADELIEQVTAAAAAEGLTLRMDIAQRANTFDAHRLIELALQHGGPPLQHEVTERLMRAYFTEGRDLSDVGELATLAKETGLEDVDVTAYLSSEAGVPELQAQLDDARALGVDSVPTFVFEGRWGVSGAQSPDVLREILQQVEQAMQGGGGCCGGGGGGCACGAG